MAGIKGTVVHRGITMDPVEDAKVRRRCRQMLVDGYERPHCEERFGRQIVCEVMEAMTREERARRHELMFNRTEAVRALAGDGSSWLAQSGSIWRSRK